MVSKNIGGIFVLILRGSCIFRTRDIEEITSIGSSLNDLFSVNFCCENVKLSILAAFSIAFYFMTASDLIFLWTFVALTLSAAAAARTDASDAPFRRLYLAAKRRVEEAEAARYRETISHRCEVDKMAREAEALAAEIARLEFQVCRAGGCRYENEAV